MPRVAALLLAAMAVAGAYWLFAQCDDERNPPRRDSEPASAPRAASHVTGPTVMDLSLQREGLDASACLLDVATGQPVAQLAVEFDDLDQQRVVRVSGTDGCLAVPSGTWRVRPQSDAWIAEPPDCELSASAQPTPLWLVHRLTLEVFVTADSGVALAGASVRWQADRLPPDAPGASSGAASDAALDAVTDGRGLALLPGWQHRPGTLTVSAAGYEPVVLALGGPAPPAPVHVVLPRAMPLPPHVQFRDLRAGEPSAGLRLQTVCGRRVQCDEQGWLPLDSGLLRELPLHVAPGQPWYPVAVPRLQPGDAVAVPRRIATQVQIVGGRAELGFVVRLHYRPEPGHGFAIEPQEWRSAAPELAVDLPEDVTSHLGGEDGGVAHGLAEVLPTAERRQFTLVLAEAPVLAIRPLRDGKPVAVRAQAAFAFAPQDWSSEWQQVYKADSEGRLAIPQPASLLGVQVFDGDWSVRVRRAKPGPTTDAEVAAALDLELGALQRVACLVACGGEPSPAGLALRLTPVDRAGSSLGQTAMAHPAWVRSAPLPQTFAIGHRGRCAPRLSAGWYRAELVTPARSSMPLVRLAEVVEFPWPADRRLDFPGVVWRDVEVTPAWGQKAIAAFTMRSRDGWQVAVVGRRWSGWTPAVELTVAVDGLGSAVIAAARTGAVQIELGEALGCMVTLHGMPTAYTAVLAVVTRGDGRLELVDLPKRAFDAEGRLRVPVEDGCRFRIEVQTEQEVLSTQELEGRRGAEYGVRLSPR